MSGHVEVLADADRPGGFLMLVDRVRQSYVDLRDPTYLDFEYVQTFAEILDADRRPVFRGRDRNVLKVFYRGCITPAADHVLGSAEVQ